MKKNLRLIISVICGVAAVFTILTRTDFGSALLGEFVEVQEGNLPITFESSGDVVALNYSKISASAAFRQRADLIDKVKIVNMVPEGKSVKRGEVIASLDQATLLDAIRKTADDAAALREQADRAVADTANQLQDLRYSLSNIRINMEIAQINMEQSLYDPPAAQRKAKLEYQKSKTIYEQNLQQYKSKKRNIVSGAASLMAKAEDLSKKQAMLQRLARQTSIVAPRCGVVYYYSDLDGVKRKAGDYITPSDLTVALMPEASSFYVENYISEDAVGKLQLKQKAEVTIKALAGETIDAEVAEISGVPELVDGAKRYRVLVKLLSNTELLRPMMTTTTNFMLDTLQNQLYVPAESLSQEGGKFYVFTKDKRKQEVEVGGKNHDNMIVLRGLQKGEQIYAELPSKQDRFKTVQL